VGGSGGRGHGLLHRGHHVFLVHPGALDAQAILAALHFQLTYALSLKI